MATWRKASLAPTTSNFAPTNLLKGQNIPPKRVTSLLGFSFVQKVKIRMNCLILFCKGARLGLLTPNLVFYPKICGQTFS
jgi:hypothetical protein